MFPTSKMNDIQDVIIVGGGLAGVSCAVELTDNNKLVTVCEKDAQLGGRISGWMTDFHLPMQHGYHAVFPEYHACKGLFERAGINLIDEDEYCIFDKNRCFRFGNVRGSALNKLRVMHKMGLFRIRDTTPKLLRFILDCISPPKAAVLNVRYSQSFSTFCQENRIPALLERVLRAVTRTLFYRPSNVNTALIVRALHFYLFKPKDGLSSKTFADSHESIPKKFSEMLEHRGVSLHLNTRVIDIQRTEDNNIYVYTSNTDRPLCCKKLVFAVDKPSQSKLIKQPIKPSSYLNVRLWCIAVFRQETPIMFTMTSTETLDCVYVCHRRENAASKWATERENGAVIELHSYATTNSPDHVIQDMKREVTPFIVIDEVIHSEIVTGYNAECQSNTAPIMQEQVHFAGDWTIEDAFLMEAAVISGIRTARRILL